MKNYYRLMLGQKSVHAAACFQGNFIGADYGMALDLKPYLAEDAQAFKHQLVPIYLETHPEKKKPAGNVCCGFLYTVAKGMQEGDILLCPDGQGTYHVGQVSGGYFYKPGEILPHHRQSNSIIHRTFPTRL